VCGKPEGPAAVPPLKWLKILKKIGGWMGIRATLYDLEKRKSVHPAGVGTQGQPTL